MTLSLKQKSDISPIRQRSQFLPVLGTRMERFLPLQLSIV